MRKGDVKTMEKICRLVISKCNDELTIQYKTEALHTIVRFQGIEAMGSVFPGNCRVRSGIQECCNNDDT